MFYNRRVSAGGALARAAESIALGLAAPAQLSIGPLGDFTVYYLGLDTVVVHVPGSRDPLSPTHRSKNRRVLAGC